MKIIATGGAGFIGSHIVDAYIAKGHKVVIIDNLVTGFKNNINKKAKFYKADIGDLALMEKIFKRERPEIVNHHAALVAVAESMRDPMPTFATNVLGTANVLVAFGKYGKGPHRKFIFSSTGGAIYGSPKKLPADEYAPPQPLSPYALSKQMGEMLIKYYSTQYKFPYFIFRYSNIYGPRQNPKGEAGVVAIFGGLMKRGVRPTIFGDGKKSRDYVYVGDVVRANLLALSKGKDDTVNIGWGAEVTDNMIFSAVAHATSFGGKPIYAPYRKGEVYAVSLSAKKAKKVLGWQPEISLMDGISRTVASI
ncbi:MAG: NAD-dependent epimerase/dehydratase family protein [Candidatus Liptonbacteria bacterium]